MGYAQIVGDQTDDFEDATTQGWSHAIPSPFDPENIATGGPAGANDNYIQMSNTGTNGSPGARHLMFNRDARWMGNYTATGIVATIIDASDGMK